MLRPSPNHGTQRLPNDDDDDDVLDGVQHYPLSSKSLTESTKAGFCLPYV